VLQQLHRQGPQTVPEMARSRPVSRQHIQTLVNELLAHSLVELRKNPAHKRSRRVALTPKGKGRIEAMLAREEIALERLPLNVTPQELLQAAQVLESVRESLKGEAWAQIVTEA
jgi:DNA-binding MarR family transcriptional regulator